MAKPKSQVNIPSKEEGREAWKKGEMHGQTFTEGGTPSWMAMTKNNMLNSASCVCACACPVVIVSRVYLSWGAVSSALERRTGLEMSGQTGRVIHLRAITISRQKDTRRLQRHCLPSVSPLLSTTKKLFAISAEIRAWQWGNWCLQGSFKVMKD